MPSFAFGIKKLTLVVKLWSKCVSQFLDDTCLKIQKNGVGLGFVFFFN